MKAARVRTATALALVLLANCSDEAPATGAKTPSATPECSRNGVCDDAVFCNGEERCENGACVAGEPVSCDDGIECTADACDESSWSCRHTAPDADSDGHADAACADARGRSLGDDCDDANAARHPGANERCDSKAIDEDCDASTVGARDDDEDGETAASCCNATTHSRQCGTDCDDTNPAIGPDADELCDGLDNDCDGDVDEHVELSLYRDADGDGYGTEDLVLRACTTLPGYALEGGDCDDDERSIHPGAPESCEEPAVDHDCNGKKNDLPGGCACKTGSERPCPLPGLCSKGVLSCVDETWTACSIAPAAEACNELDDDCDDRVDNDVTTDCYEDEDEDGYAAAGAEAVGLCSSTERGGCPGGYTRQAPAPGAIDCAPKDAQVSPAVPERCNGEDDDCDSEIDEGLPVEERFLDADGDGYAGTPVERCANDPNSQSDADDCMDDNPLVHPGQDGVFSNPACGSGKAPCRSSDEDWRCRSAGEDACDEDLDAARWDYDCDGSSSGEPFVNEPCLSADTCGDGCGPSGFLEPDSGTARCGSARDYQICRCLGAQGGGCTGSTEQRTYPCR